MYYNRDKKYGGCQVKIKNKKQPYNYKAGDCQLNSTSTP